MNKLEALQHFDGSVSIAAAEIGIRPQAVSNWPEVLPPRIADRVQAALWRRAQRMATALASIPAAIPNATEARDVD